MSLTSKSGQGPVEKWYWRENGMRKTEEEQDKRLRSRREGSENENEEKGTEEGD